MQESFDSAECVKRMGEDLVTEFERARQATTPGQVGDAMERSVRDRLGQMLPGAMGVGTGCVIDTTGGTSRQIDVVIYEKDICPVFRPSSSSEAACYPSEGVIAVGEVKSVIGAKELRDSFAKIESVKSLKREFEKQQLERDGELVHARVVRNYGQVLPSATGIAAQGPEAHEPNDDVFGFVLGDKMNTAKESMLEQYAALCGQYGPLSPNIAVFLDGTTFKTFKSENGGIEPVLSPKEADFVAGAVHPTPFAHLLRWIYISYHETKTAGIRVFGKYFTEISSPDEATVFF